MSELAYMVREDWGQSGTAMEPQSAVIRRWIGEAPYLFVVTDTKKFDSADHDADVEAADFIAPERSTRNVFSISSLRARKRDEKVVDHAIVVLHPFGERDLETIREVVEAHAVGRLFVLIWSPQDVMRTWLDGLGALDLHTGKAVTPPDPLMIEACRMMIDHEYNGLGSERGKDAVVQLVRALSVEGYPVNVNVWLQAYFAAGGTFHHAESIEKLVKEIKDGTKHRVKPRFRDDIVAIIRKRLHERAGVEG